MYIQLAPHARQHRPHLVTLCIATLGALLLVLFTTGVSLAGCPVCNPPDKVTVRSPGVAAPAVITDSGLLQAFNPVNFLDFEERAQIAAPAHPGVGYELIRYYKGEGSGLPASFWTPFWTQGFDRFHFYSNASGGPALYYDGPIGDSKGMTSAAKAGHWFRPLPQEYSALQQVIRAVADQGVPPAPQDQVATTPSTWPASGTSAPPLALAFLIGVLSFALIALLATGTIRRRRRVQPPATALDLPASPISEPQPQEEVDTLSR
jgi:hypothetical protein